MAILFKFLQAKFRQLRFYMQKETYRLSYIGKHTPYCDCWRLKGTHRDWSKTCPHGFGPYQEMD